MECQNAESPTEWVTQKLGLGKQPKFATGVTKPICCYFLRHLSHPNCNEHRHTPFYCVALKIQFGHLLSKTWDDDWDQRNAWSRWQQQLWAHHHSWIDNAGAAAEEEDCGNDKIPQITFSKIAFSKTDSVPCQISACKISTLYFWCTSSAWWCNINFQTALYLHKFQS